MNPLPYYFLRYQQQVLLAATPEPEHVFPRVCADNFSLTAPPLLIGQWQGAPCYAADFEVLPENLTGQWSDLRPIFGIAGMEAFALAARASQLLDWQKNHRFCGHCATPTQKSGTEFSVRCPACGLTAYPKISPVAMVLISRGDELLLARSPHFKPGVFSALAGFVEAGETLEACAVREVREEVGVEITNLRYFQSQPWPFPDSLMLAFFADYVSGEITPDPREIEAAAWFPRTALPLLPDPLSIARRLIDAACAV